VSFDFGKHFDVTDNVIVMQIWYVLINLILLMGVI